MQALRIALTGGIGSGKSTVARMFADRGAALIDADAIARELSAAGGAAIEQIRATFGSQALDAAGALDRARMRALIFSDPAQRARLEAILHPLIVARSAELAREHAIRAPLLLFDVPLLAEATTVRQELAPDRILVIDCPRERQIAQARARATMSEEQVLAVMASQATREQRLAIADDVLVNAGSLEDLRVRVERLWERYVASATV